ncbi:TetR/AcrR family transcriptional regulator [Cellulomonas sp. Marseille-Q8402]
MGERRDAVRNRARIVAAAEVEFRAAGAGVPLDRVAQRAGVGRGTLYRHFPDRGALIAAVYTARVDALERHVASLPPEHLLEHLVAEISAQQVDAPGLFAAVHTAHADDPALADVERRATALLADALADARRRGRARPDVTVEDVRLLFAMTEGVLAAESPDRVRAAVRRALVLSLRGILIDAPDALPEATLVVAGRVPD